MSQNDKAFATVQGIKNAHVIIAHDMRMKDNIENAVLSPENNEVWRSASSAMRIYDTEISQRIQKYTERTHQKLQKSAYTAVEVVIRVDERHHIADVLRFAKWFEQKYDTKVIQIAIHRDEINEDTNVLNQHAHILFVGLDSHGNSIYRQVMKRRQLIELQDVNAKIMGFQRGERGNRKHHKTKKELMQENAEKRKIAEEAEKKGYLKAKKELYQLKQEVINKYKEQKNYFENYQRFFQQYDNVLQKVKAGTLTVNEAKDIVRDIAGMYSRGVLDRLNVLQLSKIMQYGAIAIANLRADVRTQDSIAREVERGQNMTLSMIDKTLRSIIYFVKNKGIMPEINTTQQEEVIR